jgi:Diguanylate cyclase, GGDEF domain
MQVGASIGVSCLAPGLAVSSDTLVTEADQAMYQAKHAGKGRICLAPERNPPPPPLPPLPPQAERVTQTRPAPLTPTPIGA